MTQSEIETFFLNHTGPCFEQIQEAETEDDALALAFHELDKEKMPFDLADLRMAVRNIRVH